VRNRGRSRGQATVEFALILPLVVVGVLSLFDIAWLAVDQLQLVDAARTAARAAIVDDAEASQVAHDNVRSVLGSEASVQVREEGALLTVRVSRRHTFITPIVTQVLDHLSLTASSTMLREPRVTTIDG
jgi:Flp pilus assembly protein TadG